MPEYQSNNNKKKKHISILDLDINLLFSVSPPPPPQLVKKKQKTRKKSGRAKKQSRFDQGRDTCTAQTQYKSRRKNKVKNRTSFTLLENLYFFFFLLLLLYCCQSTTRILVSVVIQHLPGRARHFFIASSRNNICVFFSSKKDLSLSLSLTACVYYSICCSRNIFSPLHTQQPWSTFLTIIGSVVGGQLAHARDILHTSDTLYRHKFLLLKNKKKAAKS